MGRGGLFNKVLFDNSHCRVSGGDGDLLHRSVLYAALSLSTRKFYCALAFNQEKVLSSGLPCDCGKLADSLFAALMLTQDEENVDEDGEDDSTRHHGQLGPGQLSPCQPGVVRVKYSILVT